jgi:hypothetical protein
MGWDYLPKKIKTTEAAIEDLLNWSNDGGSSKVLAMSIDKRGHDESVVYCAVERVTADGEFNGIRGCVVLVDHSNKLQIGFKIMDEEMGPYYWNASEEVLGLLDDTAHPWANKWRDRCWRNIMTR